MPKDRREERATKRGGADTLYAGEKEEGSEGGTEDIGRAELP